MLCSQTHPSWINVGKKRRIFFALIISSLSFERTVMIWFKLAFKDLASTSHSFLSRISLSFAEIKLFRIQNLHLNLLNSIFVQFDPRVLIKVLFLLLNLIIDPDSHIFLKYIGLGLPMCPEPHLISLQYILKLDYLSHLPLLNFHYKFMHTLLLKCLEHLLSNYCLFVII